MGELPLEIENKLRQQVLHILGTHTEHILSTKIYDLAFEWYLKGFQSRRKETATTTDNPYPTEMYVE